MDTGTSDAGPRPDVDLPDGLAPRCIDTPIAPCLTLASSARFQTGERSADGTMLLDGRLHALDYADGPAILFTHRFPDGRGDLPPSPSRWALQRFTESGELSGAPTFLSEAYSGSATWGGDLTVVDGGLVAGWLETRYDRSFTPPAAIGLDTYLLHMDGGVRAGPMHSADVYPYQGPDVAVAAGLVVTGTTTGLLVSRDDGTGASLLIDTERPQIFEIAAAALGPHRAVVAWSEDHFAGLSMERATEVAVVTESVIEARARIFDASPLASDVSLITVDDEVWVARYDVDPTSLRESRIRIAHLDASLRRVEPDRWFAGWGGLSPAGMALVDWRATPWLVWRTLDARYGANTVLYARPIPEPVCGYDVSDPAVVWRSEAFGDRLDRLLVTSSADALWVAVPQIGGRGTADLYQFRVCD